MEPWMNWRCLLNFGWIFAQGSFILANVWGKIAIRPTGPTMRRRSDFSEPYEQKAGHREKLEMNMFKFIPTGTAKRKFAIFFVVQESEQHFVTKHKDRYWVDWEKCILRMQIQIRHGTGYGCPPLNGQVGAHSDCRLRGFRLRAMAIPMWTRHRTAHFSPTTSLGRSGENSCASVHSSGMSGCLANTTPRQFFPASWTRRKRRSISLTVWKQVARSWVHL